MAESDWAVMGGSALGTSDVPRGVTAAFTRPTGGGSFCFGYRSAIATAGFAGMYCNVATYNPFTPGTRKGGSIRAAMKRYSSGANYAPIMGVMIGMDPATAPGYMLGLEMASTYRLVLRKGYPAAGLVSSSTDVIRASTASYSYYGDSVSYWFHLRLDVLCNPHGEVVLNVFRNTGDVTSPSWAAVPGMDQFIDDPMGILTNGVLPHTTGFYGFYGHYTQASGTVSLWDHIELFRQTAP